MRLGTEMLSRYSGTARLPQYDRSQVTPGILHIGAGAFHRAHQAVFIDDLLGQSPDWGILGVSLRSSETRDALAEQDWLYTLGIRGADQLSLRVIGSLLSVQQGADAAVQALADPRIRLVTMTVTEKGYTDASSPGSLGRVLVAGLAQRVRQGAAPLTILSCDNLTDNGQAVRTLVMAAVDGYAPGIRGYLERDVAFPSSMVDRITPATTDVDRAEIKEKAGFEDRWPVVTEPFRQWVIEDHFAADRPALEKVGAEIVSDVSQYEIMKLRLLNGAHTTLAALGTLAGHSYVSGAVEDTGLAALIGRTAQTEIFPTLSLPEGVLKTYWQSLLERFRNPSIRHSLVQIATDSSKKVPVRLLPPMLEGAAAGRRTPGLALAVAGWLAFVRRKVFEGKKLHDPMAETLTKVAQSPVPEMVGGLCSVGAPLETIRRKAELQQEIAGYLEMIESKGAVASIRSVLDGKL